MDYIKQVVQETPTRVWVNNPTLCEVEKGMALNCVGATTNPTFVMKMHKRADSVDIVNAEIDKLLDVCSDNEKLVAELEKAMVQKIALKLLPLFEKTNGERGIVAIQGNPHHDHDVEYMVEEALDFFTVAPNIIVKIPGTCAGIEAFSRLTAMNKRLIITSCVSNSQIDAFLSAYEHIHKKDGLQPTLYVTTLAGPLDEFSKKYISENGIHISEEAVNCIGNQFSKLSYKMWAENKRAGRLMGGGARSYSNFTEIVGGDMDSTLNYVFIEELNQLKLPVESRIDQYCDAKIYQEIVEKLPYYEASCRVGALKPEEFDTHPPFVFFRNSFTKAWDYLTNVVAERRSL